MSEWKKIRSEIDKIDESLVRVLNKRARCGQRIAELKSKIGSPVFLPARENEILKKVSGLNRGPLSGNALQNVFREIFSATRSVEQAIRISCLGPEGTFSHLASRRIFGATCEYVLESGIDTVFQSVEKGAVHFGVVPVENAIEGTVGITHDMLMESDVQIFAELYFDIHQNLLSKAKSLGKIKTLYTHPMPLAQSRSWIAHNLPGVRIIDTSSTSEAARLAAGSKDSAAIGAEEAAKIYGLDVLGKKIEDTKGNQTRFLVISLDKSPKSGNDKTSVICAMGDAVGALSKILKPFSAKGLNLSKIQSRPKRNAEWEYIFYIDFSGHRDDPDVKSVLKKVESQTVFLKILGSYPNARG